MSHIRTTLAVKKLLCSPTSSRPLPALAVHIGTTVAMQSYMSACVFLTAS